MSRRPWCAVGLAAAVAASAAGCSASGTGGTAGNDPASAPSPAASAALRTLAGLPIHPADSMAGYARDRFGTAWTDTDHNGCGTRDDILARDLSKAHRDSDGCTVLSGSLHDPYTGTTIRFRRGQATSTAVQIDHLVALADAWRTGARRLSAGRREQLANDPDELLAVDGPANESKGDQDASSWMPPNREFACPYVAGQVAVKVKYKLWVTRAEHDSMASTLRHCGKPPTSRATRPSTAPSQTAPSDAPVHPGAFCSSPGAEGVTVDGRRERCSVRDGQQPRWRQR